MANLISRRKFFKGRTFSDVSSVTSFLQCLLQDEHQEIFGMICLDTQHRLIGRFEIFKGTINSAAVYPREIIKTVLEQNAGAVILFHNHPSGLSEPSQADIRLTSEIKNALSTIDVALLDHIVVGREDTSSLAQLGRM
ncbi:JAB domain-containing protein [uncultured Alteromonas sp.]|uniref:JAB domain-containing protein n=1 Tax=uncultured Alteromonas sp. TaxID=179113 RepID=UPI0030D1EB15